MIILVPSHVIIISNSGTRRIPPFGECDNASQVIKYVGILGYRYSSYNLVDMRIQDIDAMGGYPILQMLSQWPQVAFVVVVDRQ
jgi:hypothetical protein